MARSLIPPFLVLLVEDDPAEQRLLEVAITQSATPIKLHTVPNGTEALEYLRGNAKDSTGIRPDIVLLDLMLPGMPGIDVLREIRNDPALADLPVVILSVMDDHNLIREAYREHVNAYVHKPRSLDQFMYLIRLIDEFWFRVARLPRDPSDSVD